ncbi:DUF2306 domain-containing protein [Reichenbachiella carrageenanivorans]|uniref:DUF2306 domain-containing protein n=1 Tax=Reichenbachiella carrageenanivorans TaxID=2979869 RepID=A0ABY6CYZ5_9BACT|nr:DUF2306 domain-containing protein [Reichenbachiella carrageenanivorans]UXX79136.1 DUF2306 domain-containing protein [Reichenbachiella carrageenanivorans]
MSYLDLMYFHLITVVPCFVIGTVLLLIKKGTDTHRNMGRVYMFFMMVTALITLFMPAQVGTRIFNHFGWIHSLSFLTLYTVPTAYFAIKKGNVKSHKRKMILLYFGAILIAGVFTFTPGRYLHELFF